MKYIVFEGCEGTYKSTTARALAVALARRGKIVHETKEPGTQILPLTMKLRELMLDGQYESQMTVAAREFISQAIRSIHLEHFIQPTLVDGVSDFIIQDRGLMSGMVYAAACGFTDCTLGHELMMENTKVNQESIQPNLIVYLYRTDGMGLSVAKSSKTEFAAGDAMENRGEQFHSRVQDGFDYLIDEFHCNPTMRCGEDLLEINVTNLTTEEIVNKVLERIDAYDK